MAGVMLQLMRTKFKKFKDETELVNFIESNKLQVITIQGFTLYYSEYEPSSPLVTVSNIKVDYKGNKKVFKKVDDVETTTFYDKDDNIIPPPKEKN